MKTVSIHDAKTNLSKYMTDVKNGQQVFFGPRGEPEFEIVYHKPKKQNIYRKIGLGKGLIWEAPDAFSDETDAEIARQMLGEDE